MQQIRQECHQKSYEAGFLISLWVRVTIAIFGDSVLPMGCGWFEGQVKAATIRFSGSVSFTHCQAASRQAARHSGRIMVAFRRRLSGYPSTSSRDRFVTEAWEPFREFEPRASAWAG